MEWRLMRFYTEFKMVLFDSDLDWIGIVFCLDSFEVGLDPFDPISFTGDFFLKFFFVWFMQIFWKFMYLLFFYEI